MISFELKTPKQGATIDELEVVVDSDGLDALLAQLKFLAERKTEHVHLMAESWGGSHLADVPCNPENIAIRHVKVLLR